MKKKSSKKSASSSSKRKSSKKSSSKKKKSNSKKLVSTKKRVSKKPELVTLSLIKLMISQGKKTQAKKNLRLIISHSKNKNEQNKAQNILDNL